MKTEIIIYTIAMLLGGRMHAQIKSIPNNTETERLIQKVLDSGYYVEKCDSTDPTCFIINAQNKKAHEELKQPNIHIVRMFSPILKDSINSYELYKCFDRYFSIDTNNYPIYFFKWDKGKNIIFATTQCKTDKMNSVSYTPVISASDVDNTFLNLPENGNSILIFSMSFGVTLFINNNQIQAIVNNEIIDGGTFFLKYDLLEINRRFTGVLKNRPVN